MGCKNNSVFNVGIIRCLIEFNQVMTVAVFGKLFVCSQFELVEQPFPVGAYRLDAEVQFIGNFGLRFT